MIRAIIILGLWCGVSVMVAADDSAAAAGYYSNPARDIEFSNVQHLNRSPRVLLPTLLVKFARWGRVPVQTEGNAAPGADADVDAPVSVETLRELAAGLHTDLSSRLKSAGWEVLALADIKDSPSWAKLTHIAPDRRFGVPFEQTNVNGNARRYLIITPTNEPVVASGATGPAWAMKDMVEEFKATVMVVTYTFDVIPFVPSPMAVAANPTAGPIVPRLQLVDVNVDFRTPGMVGGSIRTRVAQLAASAGGTFTVPGAKEDKRQKALEDAAVGRGKGDLELVADNTALVASGLAVGGGFNTQVVRTISVYAPK